MEGGTLGGVRWREAHWEVLGGGRHTGSCWVQGGTLEDVL